MGEDHYVRKLKLKEKFEWILRLPRCFKIFRRDEIPWEALQLLALNYKLMSVRAFCITFFRNIPILQFLFLNEKKPWLAFPEKHLKVIKHVI